MIGNDCKRLEDNIDSFLDVFVIDGWQSQKNSKLRQVLNLYNSFKDLARFDAVTIYSFYDYYFNLILSSFGKIICDRTTFEVLLVRGYCSNGRLQDIYYYPVLKYIRVHDTSVPY